MTELEKVEKLREKADVTYAEAKEVLEKAGGDLLDALIYLEEQGKATVPAGGGYFSEAGTPPPRLQVIEQKQDSGNGSGANGECGKNESFSDLMRRFGRFMAKMLDKGSRNHLEAKRDDSLVFSIPVLAVAIFLIFFFWIVIPIYVITLFCGLRYSFRGDDLGRDQINRVMDSASDTVDGIKKAMSGKQNSTGE
ncbi:MAG: ubiquitin [Oscillospiraceae bacterium]|nr:ubiquitin [Oscillospiraceae bacterium]